MRLFIVDDHDLVREALVARLQQLPGVEVVGSAPDGPSALEALDQVSPDLVLLDFDMPGMDGAECARRVKESHPECRILFLTGYPDHDGLLEAVGLASGYVTKSASWGMLEQAIEAIAQGKAFVDPNLVPAVMRRAAAADQDEPALRRLDPRRLLTPTEGRVALAAIRRRSNQEVAAELGMSQNTVKAHLRRVFAKLGVHSRSELAARLSTRE